MDFLSIRKKARERAEAKETGAAEPRTDASPQPSPASEPPSPPPPAADPSADRRAQQRRSGVERRRGRGDEPVLTDADLAEGALQARFQGLEPSPDGRFATWRPGSGPPPVEPEGAFDFEARAPASEARSPVPTPPVEAAPARAARGGPTEPQDPLDAFFYRPDEESAVVPLLGSPLPEEPVPSAPAAIDEFLTFTLAREEFAVPIARVREVMRAPAITEVPRAPAHVMGVVTVRGEVVPVVDAHARLGLGQSSGGQARIVIVDAGEGPLGLVVDAVSSVVRLPRGSIEPCPQGIAAADCVTGIGRFRDRLFMVIDAGALLGAPRAPEAR